MRVCKVGVAIAPKRRYSVISLFMSDRRAQYVSRSRASQRALKSETYS